jgi:uncharacterized RDD family membrane protein YckC
MGILGALLNEESMDDRYRKPPGVSPPPGNAPDDGGGGDYPSLDGFDSDGYPIGSGAPAAGGNPPAAGGYPPAAGGYPPASGGNPPASGGNPPASGGYPPAAGGYPPAAGGYPPASGGYPPAGGGEHNPYAPPSGGYLPQQGYGQDPYWQSYELASLGARLGAALLDGILSFVAAIPGFFLLYKYFSAIGSSFDSTKEDDLWIGLGVMVIGLLLVSIYQWYLITTRGQSLGKKWLHIRIVKLDGSMPGFVNGVLLRGWVMSLITNVPYIGGIVGLVDPLLIFGQERRCLHDLIASTRVIVGDPEDQHQAHGYMSP